VFSSGFVILAVEILGIRILAPFVGATAPVWASIIGVTLAGSALGYCVGGFISDKISRHTAIIFLLSIISGASIWSAPKLRFIIAWLAANISYNLAALLSSVIMFFLPVAALSMMTIIAIRTQAKSINAIAKLHGELYGIATAGSIFGVFATAYILVPNFSIPKIMAILAAIPIVSALLVYKLNK